MNVRNFEHDDSASGDSAAGRRWLVLITALLLGAGVGLATFAGSPRLPSGMPRLEQVAEVLSGTNLPLQGLALFLVDVAWVVWAWSVLSVVLELAVLAAELIASGRGWVRSLRRVVDRLSLPLVRRAVAAAFAVEMIGRTVTVAGAQPLPSAEPVVVAAAPATAATAQDRTPTAPDSGTPTYLVRPGDTLWSIAEKAYGSGLQYRRLVDANLGRSMGNGQLFTAQGVIQPGWKLLAPDATWDTEEQDGEQWYTVRPGDSLSSIAEMLLGDRARWQELFELNHGATTDDGQHALVEPDTIWPGLRLQLPEAPAEIAEQEPEPAPPELLVASAPTVIQSDAGPLGVAPAPAEPAPLPSDADGPDPLPPLMRTPHALQPVVLDLADSPPPDADAPASDPAAPEPVAETEVTVPRPPSLPTIPDLAWVIGGLGLAGLGIAGLAFGARRLRRFRPLPQEPESEVVVEGGFAEAQLAHDLTRGLHGVGFDPVTALVAQLQQFLVEYNLSDVEVLTVRHGRSSTTITLRCGLAEQSLLLDVASAFAERLEADVEACISDDQDVVWRLIRLRKTRLLPTAESLEASPCLVPLGVLYDRQTYAAAWASLGHTLVVSLPGHGADTILASLLATVTARRSPEQLRVWLVASPRSLPAALFDLPHVVNVVDPTDAEALGRLVEQLRADLDWRAAQELPVADALLVVPELAALGEHAASLALLAARAAELGVRVAAASADPDEAVGNPLTSCFATRLVLRMQAEDVSVALLGVADAAFLAGGGRLLLRLDGREPVELYGYRVAPEHLERLVKVMRSAYPTLPPTSPAAPPPRPGPEPPLPDPEPPTDEATTADGTASPPPEQPSPAQNSTTLAAPQSDARDQSSEVLSASLAPIQVFCLGTPRVMCMGEHVWPRRGSGDAKPWELLLFLACQPLEGVARSAVMEALWGGPESMGDDANHRFRQLRYRLRRQLQQVPDAPSSDGICLDRRGFRLDPALVYSDAQEFLSLLREARLQPNSSGPQAIACLERARALYSSDLLDGPDIRRYAWVDERDDSGVTLREHFRRLLQNACMRLAEAYTATGRLAEAIEVYHDLTDMDPSDERLFQALFRLHAEADDILGLEEEERRMRRLLQELSAELGGTDGQSDEPDKETMQEYQRLLASMHQRTREPAHA